MVLRKKRMEVCVSFALLLLSEFFTFTVSKSTWEILSLLSPLLLPSSIPFDTSELVIHATRKSLFSFLLNARG